MKYSICIIFLFCFLSNAFCQDNQDAKISLSGIVRDASSYSTLPGTQIMINNIFSSLTGDDGTFEFYVFKYDTIIFKRLGYKPAIMVLNDTLYGKDFIAGVYMHSDTISAGEVVIVPRLINLKSEMMMAGSKTPPEFENARYNLAVSAYQARTSQGSLGDPADNYAYLVQKQKTEAYEKGGIPSDKIVGMSAILLIPSAYMLIKNLSEKPPSMKARLTGQEVDQIHRKYIESIRK